MADLDAPAGQHKLTAYCALLSWDLLTPERTSSTHCRADLLGFLSNPCPAWAPDLYVLSFPPLHAKPCAPPDPCSIECVTNNQARHNVEWPERESLFTTLYEETYPGQPRTTPIFRVTKTPY